MNNFALLNLVAPQILNFPEIFYSITNISAEMDDGERDFEDINYDPQIVNSTAFRLAIKTFMKNIPVKTNGCNMRKYKNKEQHIVSYHRTKLANVVSKWNGVERKYNKMKSKDPVQAEAEMKSKESFPMKII